MKHCPDTSFVCCPTPSLIPPWYLLTDRARNDSSTKFDVNFVIFFEQNPFHTLNLRPHTFL